MRFMQPHQRQVTRVLQFAAQASHELVPPEIIEPLIKTLVNNFVTERNSSDVMAVGLNAAREICARCPLAMSEDLLRDLALYKNYKEKSVVMAARSLISLFREQLPALLHKKDRGRPTEASAELKPKKYGEVLAEETIPGAEALLKAAPEVTIKEKGSKKRKREEDSEDGDWVDVSDEEGENVESDFEIDETDSEDEGSDEEDDESEDDAESEEEEETEQAQTTTEPGKTTPDSDTSIQILDEKQAAKEIALTRIFTDEDFARIEAELVKKKVTNARKRPIETERQEFVKLDNIEMIYKKRRTDKQARLESMAKGKEGREKFGYKDGRMNLHCSKTNREKRKNKNFQMIRHKERGKIKKSFRDKQLRLRKHLIQQKKMK